LATRSTEKEVCHLTPARALDNTFGFAPVSNVDEMRRTYSFVAKGPLDASSLMNQAKSLKYAASLLRRGYG
jgi:hypothetical protein